jgi:hypothetical protein
MCCTCFEPETSCFACSLLAIASTLKTATGKIRADINFVNPYLHAKIRTRIRARNPSRVGNNAHTRYLRIPACPRIPVPVRRSRTKSTWPGRGRRAPPARGLGAASAGTSTRPAQGLGAGVGCHRRGDLGAALVSWDGRAASVLGAAVRPCPIPVRQI